MADLTDERLDEGDNGAWHRHLTTEEMGALFSEVRRHRATMRRLDELALSLEHDHNPAVRTVGGYLRDRIKGDTNG